MTGQQRANSIPWETGVTPTASSLGLVGGDVVGLQTHPTSFTYHP